MRHCFDSDNRIALGFLFLIEAFDSRIIADGKIGGFHKRPGQILIAVFGIGTAFTFAVADFLTPHTPTLRSVVSNTGKSLDLSGLEHDGERRDGADPRHCL